MLSAMTILFGPAQWASAAEEANSCETCHSSPDFLVTNKQLYDYYQEWSQSVHEQEEVSCDDCHGGDAGASDADTAHAGGLGASTPTSGVHYKNVVDTCGTCHDEILEGFLNSEHFAHVEKDKGDKQGPTCVTCHGAINSEVLNVNSVAESCERCHNEKTDNHPDHPEEARKILNRFLSIHRFYRYITIRAEPLEAREFFEKIDPQLKKLVITWHAFDLEKIDHETTAILAALTAKRDEIRARAAKSKASAEGK